MLLPALLSAALADPACLTPALLSGAEPGFGPAIPPRGTPLPPRAAFVNDTCWGQQAPHRAIVGRFAVEYEDGFDASLAADFGEALNDAYEALVFDEGWTRVHGDDQYLLLAYIDPGSGGAAYTTTGACGGSVAWMPYIVVTSDAFEDSDWWHDMAAHELNHAQQFSYEAGHEAWWWEATAVWVEEQVNPRHDTWIRYVNEGFAAQPWLAMRGSSQRDPDVFLHMYGMAIWAFFLEEHRDHELVLRTWEEAAGAEFVNILDELAALGEDPDEALEDFLAANAAMDYSHRALMDRTAALAVHESLPAEGSDSGATAPQSLGQAFVRLPTSGFDEDLPSLRVTVDADGDWTELLVGVRDGAVAEVLSFEDEGVLGEPGSFDELWLAVSPKVQSAGHFSWSYAAEATDAEPDGGGGGGGTVTRPSDRDGVGTLPGDSGRCGSTRAGPWLLGWVLLWARRDRRRAEVRLGPDYPPQAPVR